MVDNFGIIRKLLKFEEEGDCYYVQLLRRAADDPKPEGVPDPKYHGNMHSRSIQDYFIHSLEHLDRVEGEIKELCHMFNVRAYIRLNRRSYKKIALQMLKHIAEQVSSGESFSSPHHLVSSAAGTVHNETNKTWIVDLDAPYLGHEEQIKHLICMCEPIRSFIYDTVAGLPVASVDEALKKAEDAFICNYMTIVPTKSGKHIIVRPFNKKEFIDKWPSVGLAHLVPCDIHKDNPTILYVP